MREIAWLPEFIDSDAEEAHEEYVDRLYSIFRNELMNDPPTVFDPRTIVFSNLITDGRCESFHHCTTKDLRKTCARVFEPHRAKRIRWIRPMIESFADTTLTVTWRKRTKGEMRFKIALPDFRYVVVFTESSRTMFLVSAFYVTDRNYRAQLARESRRGELPI